MRALCTLIAPFCMTLTLPAAEKTSLTPKSALQALNHLIGSWKGTGQPEGTLAEKRRGFWVETIHWEWQFAKEDIHLSIRFEKGKHFQKGELRYLPKEKKYQLTLHTPKKERLTFLGEKEGRHLTLFREGKEAQKLVFTFLHSNRYLYRLEVKPENRTRFKKAYQVGATKKGVPFASSGSSYPECIVSGGRGTTAVSHKGKTYYVCCSGCKAEFEENPEKYTQRGE